MSIVSTLSIAIITFRRPLQLQQCLESISTQPDTPHTVIVIDNDVHKSAQNICFSKKFKFKIKYFNQPIKGISQSRNLALKLCPTQYLAFIDDDCLLASDWLTQWQTAQQLHPDAAFIQGISQLANPKSSIAQVQSLSCHQWLESNIYNTDTKNLTLNLRLINKHKLSFDTNLPIFEDVDFGLQLQKSRLTGYFCPYLSVYHPEVTHLFRVIKKTYYRGQIKNLINQKWGNFDNYRPLELSYVVRSFKKLLTSKQVAFDFYKILFDFIFSRGYLSPLATSNRYLPTIFIVNTPDQSANGQRTTEVSRFLTDHGYQTNIVNSQQLFDTNINRFSNYLYFPINYIQYCFIGYLIYKFHFVWLQSQLSYVMLHLRNQLTRRHLQRNQALVVIAQGSEDFLLALNPRNYKVILDIPTIYSEEIKSGNNLSTRRIIHKINRLENLAYQQADNVCFHWYSFLSLAAKINKTPAHGFILNWGCSPTSCQTQYKPDNPQIIYLGKLNSDWINPALLEKIAHISPIPLDIYSYESPDPCYYKKLKTKGFLKKLDDISHYQFGLLTFTDDELRNNGFSAKHMTYLSYGLPVLCPEWRRDPVLESATIYYNENNLSAVIKKYSQKKYWLPKHKAAIRLAKKLQWDTNLLPLLSKISKFNKP